MAGHMFGLFVTWVFISRGMGVHTIKQHPDFEIWVAEDSVLLGCEAISVAFGS
jgi:hypothetical protein